MQWIPTPPCPTKLATLFNPHGWTSWGMVDEMVPWLTYTSSSFSNLLGARQEKAECNSLALREEEVIAICSRHGSYASHTWVRSWSRAWPGVSNGRGCSNHKQQSQNHKITGLEGNWRLFILLTQGLISLPWFDKGPQLLNHLFQTYLVWKMQRKDPIPMLGSFRHFFSIFGINRPLGGQDV